MSSPSDAVEGPRILLTAGKGGVGKTTVAAATAALCAARGPRVLVMSIDSAHNLSDLFGVPLGPTPTPLAERLHGLEVDLNGELRANWHSVIDFFRTMTANDPRVTDVVAEECAVLPGMEEVFGLMRLQSVVESGKFDVIVVDAPPTGDLLKFLRLPDVVHWFMGRYRPLERGLLQRMRPVTEAMGWPLPPEEAVAEMEQWYARVRQCGATLTDSRRVSVRLVMTPDRVGLAETQRAFTWTSLLGMNVDAVIVNRLLPAAGLPPSFQRWAEKQSAVLAAAEGAFSSVPVLRAEQQPDEVLGAAALKAFGASLYGERDPAGLWSAEPPVQWTERPGSAELRLRLPFLKKGAFRLLSGPDGLTLHVENQRRLVPLPAAVRHRSMRRARYEDGWLRVEYGPAEGE
ncbi:MAG TPA: TRC40/GET3/ArsA family transport-energizing ATPase [Armatimonadota bacterium]|nr:TRC40/GET3/ArsA family transport-energizing ATPase [Armatimonadota bacterium]